MAVARNESVNYESITTEARLGEFCKDLAACP